MRVWYAVGKLPFCGACYEGRRPLLMRSYSCMRGGSGALRDALRVLRRAQAQHMFMQGLGRRNLLSSITRVPSLPCRVDCDSLI